MYLVSGHFDGMYFTYLALPNDTYTSGANLTYLAHPHDNFSWVPNLSLGSQKFKEFLSSTEVFMVTLSTILDHGGVHTQIDHIFTVTYSKPLKLVSC